MIGTTIGNYVVKDKIGEGGMGVVYVAEHPRIGRKVAIKVLLPEYSQNADVVSRFFTEARASSAIKNEHIIDIIDFGELADKSSYIIMEWLEGEPLTSTLEREQRIPVERALHVARGIGRALAAAHSRGIVHRDLKPDNIFLVTRGEDHEFAKVLDFGIAKLLGNEGAGAPQIASKTRTGAIIGTPMYMSPEQCRGVAVDERSDIYSFAVIVYQMLTGSVPFVSEGLGELLLKHMTEVPRPPREIDGSIPENVECAVMRALEKEPDKRYRRVEDFVAELGGQTVPALPVARATQPLVSPPTAVHVSAIDTIGAASGETVAGTAPPPRRVSPFVYAALPILIAGVAVAGIMRRPSTINERKGNDGRGNETAAKQLAVMPARPTATAMPPPTTPEPTRARLSVRATPGNAQILIDGQAVDNPYGQDRALDGHVYAVEISAPGYATKKESLKLDQPRELALELVPVAGAAKDGKHKLPAAPPPAAHHEPKVATPEPKADHPPKPEATPEVDKGPTIYKGTKAKLQTDDPYATH